MRFEDFIESSSRAQNVDALFDDYKKAMHQLGFDRLIFSLMTDHVSIDRNAGHGIILNYSDDWMNYYTEKSYDVYDPVRRQMFSAAGTFRWDDVMEVPTLTDTQKTLMYEADDAGMKSGIGIPLRGPRGALAGIGAASSTGGVALDDKVLLSYAHLISQQFYTVFLELESNRTPDGDGVIFLTDREQEILKWCGRGKTRGEIATLLSLSDRTVNFHINNALKKLGASNVTLGVLKALHRGLIQI
ncbi:MAG: autoinducer binding domain-containing protein [Alphaproteobacteria bacterium]|nr:autoinducer binding domain-containing protein [Alphaproteobacteria bacterium]